MKSFRNPKYLERYEDVIFDLEQPINTTDPAAANTAQTLSLLLIIQEKLLHLIGIMRVFRWILK